MIECAICKNVANGVVFVSGVHSRPDWPCCIKCSAAQGHFHNRFVPFKLMEGIVRRWRMDDVVGLNGEDC